jgi:hypothetical protein
MVDKSPYVQVKLATDTCFTCMSQDLQGQNQQNCSHNICTTCARMLVKVSKTLVISCIFPNCAAVLNYVDIQVA